MKIILAGHMIPIPGPLVRYQTRQEAGRWGRINARFSPLEAEVRRLAVRHLPASGSPLTAEAIAELGGYAASDVAQALEALHRKLGFLAINQEGAVTWAYPVTADRSPHHLAFETGERMTAA